MSDFFLSYSLKPRVKYEFYRNWSIVQLGSSFGAIFLSFSMKAAGENPWPLVTALYTHSPHHHPPPPNYKASFQYYQNEEQDRVDANVTYSSNKSFSLRRW